MRDDDRHYLLTVALEMRLAVRDHADTGQGGLLPGRMAEIADRLERIGAEVPPVDPARFRHARGS